MRKREGRGEYRMGKREGRGYMSGEDGKERGERGRRGRGRWIREKGEDTGVGTKGGRERQKRGDFHGG